MTSPKPTPRDIPKIPEAGIIPIRAFRPAEFGPPIGGERPAQPPRPRSIPVAERPYRVLVVPPTPGARTRAFNVARWQAWGTIASMALTVFVAGATVSTFVGSLRGPDIYGPSGELAYLRDRLHAVGDSLSATRAELDDARYTRDSLSAFATSGSRRPRPLLNRVRRVVAPVDMTPIEGAEGLPVIGRIASTFSHARRHPLLKIIRPHLGIDVAAPRGTRINAPAAGIVSFVGRRFAYGLVVEIQHEAGIVTRYAHLRTAAVKAGDRVALGASIATVGSSGLSSGPHLHYEVLDNGRAVDPLRFRMPRTADTVATMPSANVQYDSASAPVAPPPN